MTHSILINISQHHIFVITFPISLLCANSNLKKKKMLLTLNNNCYTQRCPFLLFIAKLQSHSIHPDGCTASPQKQPRSIAFPAPLILCFMYLHIQGKRAALFLLCCKVTAASHSNSPITPSWRENQPFPFKHSYFESKYP